jgi:hypothetical protein
MSTTLITAELKAITADAEDGLASMKAGIEEVRAGIWKLATALLRGREYFRDNDTAFGRWLDENEHLKTINHQDRAALLNMARHPEATHQALAATERTSPQHIWKNEITAIVTKSQTFTHVSKGSLNATLQPLVEANKPINRKKIARKFGVGESDVYRATLYERGRQAGLKESQTEKMVSIHVLIEELQPLFKRVLAQSKLHRINISQAELGIIASQGFRLLDRWAGDEPDIRRVRGHVAPQTRRKGLKLS